MRLSGLGVAVLVELNLEQRRLGASSLEARDRKGVRVGLLQLVGGPVGDELAHVREESFAVNDQELEIGLRSVAEGVETQGQLDYLARAGCDESQGFLHSRPIPRVEFEQLLTRVNANPVPVEGFNAVGPA